MDKAKVAELLYAEFGNEEFLTRHISEETMGRLADVMGISETGHARNTKVGKGIGSLDRDIFTLEGGGTVTVLVYPPEHPRQPRRFQLINYRPVDAQLRAEALAVESRQTGGPYGVVLIESGQGWAAVCPALPGCVSQGEDEEDAISNIEEAIVGWLSGEGRDVERRTQELLDEYQSAGFSAKLVKISLA